MTQAHERKRSVRALMGRMGEYLFEAGRLVEAESTARENIEGDVSYKSFVTLAKVLQKKERLDEAIQVLRGSESAKLRLDERAPIRDLLHELLGEAERDKEQSALEEELLEALRARLVMYRNKRFVEQILYWSGRILRINPNDDFAIECMRLTHQL